MIKDVLANLSKVEYETLMLAFDNASSYVIRLDNNDFIGVHVVPDREMEIIETSGYFVYGVYRCNYSR